MLHTCKWQLKGFDTHRISYDLLNPTGMVIGVYTVGIYVLYVYITCVIEVS